MSIPSPQADGLCLQFPENLGQRQNLPFEEALNFLSKGYQAAHNVPFQWRYIDKPPEGQIALLFLTSQFPNDGIRYQEQEVVYSMNAGGRELEVVEAKSGFIPGSQDQSAWRVRRRYRLIRGGHPSLVLVHYTRQSPTPIIPALLDRPVRVYPLRPVTEPPVYVLGDKQGQKVFAQGSGMPPGPPGPGFAHPAQAALLNQNRAFEQLDRRHEREREKERAHQRNISAPGRHVDDQSDDEVDQISTRALALARYKRNHELMEEVFRQAAFGDKADTTPQKSPYSIFNKEDLERRTAQLQADIERLQQKSEERKPQQQEISTDSIDTSMERST
ncbi:hypothetical protein CC1G_07181 [Coprinopsis cinerea okayama7|uniref:SWI/SNF and RSC complexes subunit Ssr4 N-terminal domain-containing protein n=1 Tax=Coprinopsis cinerea (strain Okayama-7 / 130 / ATCC MYA-4618 / FGSC 9003) TaxID=240176 RepID=A8NRD2_COPC7|nr:hypothetical protein CC1G_07181 [Coprinopsis cinerea okayama7\|eukprot:XP_001835757.1 hypothetical protein CC1G_07181 [Coprinopsis cinerea okayama7\